MSRSSPKKPKGQLGSLCGPQAARLSLLLPVVRGGGQLLANCPVSALRWPWLQSSVLLPRGELRICFENHSSTCLFHLSWSLPALEALNLFLQTITSLCCYISVCSVYLHVQILLCLGCLPPPVPWCFYHVKSVRALLPNILQNVEFEAQVIRKYLSVVSFSRERTS